MEKDSRLGGVKRGQEEGMQGTESRMGGEWDWWSSTSPDSEPPFEASWPNTEALDSRAG